MDTKKLLHDTTVPYSKLPSKGIEYTVCRDFDNISRYRRLRQVIHYLEGNDRFKTLEIQNCYDYQDIPVEYYIVPAIRENRLDLISYDYYGTSEYSWILAYVNKIPDGFTVFEGQIILIPVSISSLFESGNILSAVPVTSLNLGTE